MTCSVINKRGPNRSTLIAYYLDYTWVDYNTVILCCYFRELYVSYIYYDVVSTNATNLPSFGTGT